jgi:hypothetical protein
VNNGRGANGRGSAKRSPIDHICSSTRSQVYPQGLRIECQQLGITQPAIRSSSRAPSCSRGIDICIARRLPPLKVALKVLHCFLGVLGHKQHRKSKRSLRRRTSFLRSLIGLLREFLVFSHLRTGLCQACWQRIASERDKRGRRPVQLHLILWRWSRHWLRLTLGESAKAFTKATSLRWHRSRCRCCTPKGPGGQPAAKA